MTSTESWQSLGATDSTFEQLQHERVQYIGLGELDLDPLTQQLLHRTVTHRMQHLERVIRDDFSVVIHIRKYNVASKQHRFVAHVRVLAPHGIIASSSAENWDAVLAAREALDECEVIVLHHAKKARFFGNKTQQRG